MPLDLKKRREAVLPLTIAIDGEQLNIKYLPDRVTPEDLRGLARIAKSDASEIEKSLALVEDLEEKFLKQVVEWDAEDDGVPVPLTRPGLAEHGVDVPLMSHILEAIRDDQAVPLEKKKPSGKP